MGLGAVAASSRKVEDRFAFFGGELEFYIDNELESLHFCGGIIVGGIVFCGCSVWTDFIKTDK